MTSVITDLGPAPEQVREPVRAARPPGPPAVTGAIHQAEAARWRLNAVRPADRPALHDLFADCSPTTIRQRFFGRMTVMPRPYLDSLLTGPPAVHDAVVARPGGGADRRIVALASLAADAIDPGQAEIGILVADDWQGHGLGSALLDLLLDRARARGVERINASVLPGRFELLAALARRLEFVSSVSSPDGLASVYMLSSAAGRTGPRPPHRSSGGSP